jgi:hypothetical protein
METLMPVTFLSLVLLGSLFWVWMLIDCASKESNEGNTKIVWILIIVHPHHRRDHLLFRQKAAALGRIAPLSSAIVRTYMIKASVITEKPLVILAAASALWLSAASRPAETWLIDNLARIGGNAVTVLGHPRVISVPGGHAVEFNGVDDALFLDVHPLAGAETWTWEVIFRPASGGAAEQRFFHFQENGTDNRMLFEIRVIGDQWCLDSFAKGGKGSQALLDRTKLHPLDKWYHVAAVYDGQVFRNYVDGVPEGEAAVKLEPQKAGQTSIGVRFNKVNYFKGGILEARMTARALKADEFTKKP